MVTLIGVHILYKAMKLFRCLLLIIGLCLFASCQKTEREHFTRMVNEWMERKSVSLIIFNIKNQSIMKNFLMWGVALAFAVVNLVYGVSMPSECEDLTLAIIDAAGGSAAVGYCDATTKDECRVEVINAGTVYGKGKGFIISN